MCCFPAYVEEEEKKLIDSQKPDVFEHQPELGKSSLVAAIVTAQQLSVAQILFLAVLAQKLSVI